MDTYKKFREYLKKEKKRGGITCYITIGLKISSNGKSKLIHFTTFFEIPTKTVLKCKSVNSRE